MSTVTTTSSATALQQPFEGQSWILPDNSLVLLMNAGTINFSGANTNHTIVLQSTNWQNVSPTWTFVKQITTTANEVVASYWDGTRLHVAYANSSAGNTSGLFYISASYSGGTWTWDGAATTLIAASDPTNDASSPSIIADSQGVVYVAYRNQAVASPNNKSVCMFTKTAGGWNSTPVQMSATSSTSATYYGALSYGNNTVVLVTIENASYYAQIHPDNGAWGTTAAGPTSQVGTGQQFGPLTVIADGSSGAWVGISSTSGMKAQHLTWSSGVVTWGQGLTTIDSASNVSAPQWLFCNGVLYGYYFKLTSANNADVYTVQYNPIANRWSSATNLTNNTANNNVNPIVPTNYVYSGTVPVMPYIWETGTASPFTINLATQAPIAQTGQQLFAARFRLATNAPAKLFSSRFDLGQPRYFSSRFSLQPATVATDSLLDGKFGMTYGLRSPSDTLDVRVPVLARALGLTWFRIQQNIGNIWTTQSDITSGTITTTAQTNPNWASIDQAIGLLNSFGLHVIFPLRAVNGTPSWFFNTASQQATYSTDGTGNWFLPDPANMALFASAAAYRYDGVHGPIGPNGTPLRVDAFEVGNEEYNQKNSPRILVNGLPTAATIYGLYNSPLSTYNAIAPTLTGAGGLPPQPARDPHFFANVLKQVAPAIRLYNTSVKIGSCSLWWMNPVNFSDFLKGFYLESGVTGLLSYWTFHYYSNLVDPNTGTTSTATITQAIQNMQAQNQEKLDIWLTEFGWGTTDVGNGIDCDQNTQAGRFNEVMTACLNLGVKKMFLYTGTYRTPSETSSIIQYNPAINTYQPLPSYYTVQNIIVANSPVGNIPAVVLPAISRRTGTGLSTTRRTGTGLSTKRRG